MIPEIKRGLRFPRKHVRWFWSKRKRMTEFKCRSPQDAFDMYELLKKHKVKIDVEYNNPRISKSKDERYWEFHGWLGCLEWLGQLREFKDF